MSELRLYDYADLGPDGYPAEWHATIKYAVREAAGHRCVRCGHPYRVGRTNPEWSPCDDRCTHAGPVRYRHGLNEDWLESAEMIPGRQFAYDATHTAVNPANPQEVLAPIEIQARWRILTVHHLDGNKADCRWWNLVALCQRCHLAIQGKVQMARVWPWEHTAWFRPYVAGYYAWVYLGEDVTREEVETRLEDLLALERVA